MPDSGAARDRLQGPVAGMVLLAEEVDPTGHYREGAVTQILVNAYERDPAARRACINHYGTVCSICGFDFETVYGDIAVNRNGERFIHVHHLRDLASLGGSTDTDPIEDLRPVCANCHAMLHTDVPAHDINWLRIRVVSRRAD